jgi:hypothetical protein
MDRQYKAEDTVTVHQDDKDGPVLATFKQQPFTAHGYDNYMHENRMYKGFSRPDGSVYILLSEPLFKDNLCESIKQRN